MKKMIIVTILALAMLFSMAASAYATGAGEGTFATAVELGDVANVHGTYAATTNACKVCHDVHGNANAKLFIAAVASDGCILCHDALGLGAAVYQGVGTTAHLADETITIIPDGTGGVFDGNLGCMDCHSAAPHGAFEGTYGKLSTVDGTETDFCASCHLPNDGRVAGVNPTHIMVAQDLVTYTHALTGATSATCASCHTNFDGTDNADYPHEGNYKLLNQNVSSGTDLDDSCRPCHVDSTLNAEAGVGYDY